MVQVVFNGNKIELKTGTTLRDAVKQYADLEDEGLFLAKVNGQLVHSTLDNIDVPLCDGDRVEVFPLVLGG